MYQDEYTQKRKKQAEDFKAILSEVATTVLPGYVPGDQAEEKDLPLALAAVVYKMFDKHADQAQVFMLRAMAEYLAYACNWTASAEFEIILKRVENGESLTAVLRGQ